MRTKFAIAVAVVSLLSLHARAALIPIDISPEAGSALSSVNYTNGDHAVGLSALNTVAQPASSATGNEIGGGVFFDDVSKELTYNVGYGSDFGFVDLVGNWTAAHIHGPVAVQFPSANTAAGVLITLSHTAGSTTQTGSFTGTAPLTPTQESDLMNNLLYINIHSSFEGGGEIRGQLVPVIPEPASMGLVLVGGLSVLWFRRRVIASRP